MEQVAVRIEVSDAWTRLGGDEAARKAREVVVRAFDGDVLAATGRDATGPDTEPILVPHGEGRRLTGHHFFVRPAPPAGPRLVTYRGL